MVTGQMPFRAASEKELLEKIRKGEHEPVRRLRREAPDSLARAIEAGMAAQTAQRFSRAADLLAALQKGAQGAVVSRNQRFNREDTRTQRTESTVRISSGFSGRSSCS